MGVSQLCTTYVVCIKGEVNHNQIFTMPRTGCFLSEGYDGHYPTMQCKTELNGSCLESFGFIYARISRAINGFRLQLRLSLMPQLCSVVVFSQFIRNTERLRHETYNVIGTKTSPNIYMVCYLILLPLNPSLTAVHFIFFSYIYLLLDIKVA